MKRETILIGREAHEYLADKQRKERGFNDLSQEVKDKRWRRMTMHTHYPDKRIVTNDSYGGGDGMKNGKWWSWSLTDIKKMLDEAGYSYEQGEEEEYFNV